MLCKQCLGIKLAEGPGQDVAYELHESYDALKRSASAGCEGCDFFEYMMWRSMWWYSDEDRPTPPDETHPVVLKTACDEQGVFKTFTVLVERSAHYMFLDPYLMRGNKHVSLVVIESRLS